MSNHEHTENIVKYYARLYVVRGGNEGLWKLPTNRSLTMNVFSNTAGSASAAPRDTASERSRIGEANSEYVIAEKIIDLDDNFAHYMSADQLKSLTTFGKMKLEVDYSRVLNYQPGGSNASAAGSTLRQSTSTMGAGDFAGNSTFGGTGSVGVGAVSYKLRIRLVDDSNELENMTTGTATNGTKSNKNDSYLDDLQATAWDLEVPLDLSLFVKCTGGQSWVGVVSAGLLLDNQAFLSAHEYLQQQEQQKNALPWQQNSAVGQPRAFSLQLYALHFESKGTLFSFPVCSPYTSARHPDTFLKMEEELAKIRTWMNIKMQFQFPPLFKVIFDAESVRHYERIFSLVMKIRFVSRMLEKLWMSRSKFLTDRLFCNIRHAMHFFISNLLYYLQVDVVDSEYARLLQELEHVTDFQSVLKHHKHFIANILRLSMIDNMGIQESMDRIVQVCLRFVAACRLQSKSEFQYDLAQDDKPSFGSRPEVAKGKEGTDGAQSNSHSASQPPVYIPIEEFEAIRKEFYLQVSYLFQFMRKVESRGFLFRLDFNGFLSQASLDS